MAVMCTLRFQLNLFDARNFSRHFPDAVDGLLAVVIRHVVPKLIYNDVQQGFWLAETVLRGPAARMQRARSDSGEEQRGPRRDVHFPLSGRPPGFTPFARLNQAQGRGS